MYLISVYFDDATNKTIQRYINQVAAKTGNTFMLDNNVPPHLTISSIEARNVDVLIPAFESLNEILSSGEIQFVSTGQLHPYVMYITPVLNEYLQNLQEVVFNSVKNIEETTVSKYYKPYSWLPHITIGKKLDKEQMKEAFYVMQESFIPFKGKIIKIGLAKVNPHEDVATFML